MQGRVLPWDRSTASTRTLCDNPPFLSHPPASPSLPYYLHSVCLDHMLSNVKMDDFCVLADDISDHRALSACLQLATHISSTASAQSTQDASVITSDHVSRDHTHTQLANTGGDLTHASHPRDVAGSHPGSNSRHAPTTAESLVEGGLGVMIPQGLVAPARFAVKLLGISRGVDVALMVAEKLQVDWCRQSQMHLMSRQNGNPYLA